MHTHYAQIQNPVNKEWYKLDRRTGRIVAHSDAMFPRVDLLKPKLEGALRPYAERLVARRLERIMDDLRLQHETYDDLLASCREVEKRIDDLTTERDELERPLSVDAMQPRPKLPVERVAVAFGAAMYGDGRPWGTFDERERDALKRGAHAALREAQSVLEDIALHPVAP